MTKIIETDNPRDLVEASLAMCIKHVTVTIGLLGSPVAVMTLPSELIQSTQKQLLEAQLALVAELTSLSVWTIRRRIADGQIRNCRRSGNRILIPIDQLERIGRPMATAQSLRGLAA